MEEAPVAGTWERIYFVRSIFTLCCPLHIAGEVKQHIEKLSNRATDIKTRLECLNGLVDISAKVKDISNIIPLAQFISWYAHRSAIIIPLANIFRKPRKQALNFFWRSILPVFGAWLSTGQKP